MGEHYIKPQRALLKIIVNEDFQVRTDGGLDVSESSSVSRESVWWNGSN